MGVTTEFLVSNSKLFRFYLFDNTDSYIVIQIIYEETLVCSQRFMMFRYLQILKKENRLFL